MAQEQDKLVPIAPELWPELRDKFEDDLPSNKVPYNTIQNYIKWIQFDPRIQQLEILSLNDTWRDNGTYIIIDRYYMYFHTLDESNDSLRRALRLIDWDYSYRISQIHNSCKPALDEIIRSFEIETKCYYSTALYKMPKEVSANLEFDVPNNVMLKQLEPKDVTAANRLGSYQREGSKYTIKRLAAWNPSMGLFDIMLERMVAWCVCWPTGSIGEVQVDNEYRGKGICYGSLVVKAIAQAMAARGMDCYASGTTSNLLHERPGFELIDYYYVVQTRSKKLSEYGFSAHSGHTF